MNAYQINPASLDWNEQGTPVSREFGDVYFSNESGLDETRHVFLQGNDIPQRFYHHPRSFFMVAETGFGTGLNFLTLWQSWRQFSQHSTNTTTLRNLHFISFEKHPLQLADIVAAHQSWPELAEYAILLQQQWPLPLAGCHRLQFDQGRITLDLWFGDVNQQLPKLDRSFKQSIDAWFLDGFAPSKNPDMWSEALFKQIVSFTRFQGTFATYTAAGFVRRGLQQAGFEVIRRKGFGPKREMLAGTLMESVPSKHSQA